MSAMAPLEARLKELQQMQCAQEQMIAQHRVRQRSRGRGMAQAGSTPFSISGWTLRSKQGKEERAQRSPLQGARGRHATLLSLGPGRVGSGPRLCSEPRPLT